MMFVDARAATSRRRRGPMNRIRHLAASLLCLDGLLHVSRLGMAELDPTFVTTATVFGVAYLVIGGLLFRDVGAAYYLGAFTPIVGLLVGDPAHRRRADGHSHTQGVIALAEELPRCASTTLACMHEGRPLGLRERRDSPSGPVDQYRNRAVGEHPLRLAPQDQADDPGPPV
jgi:hypothetical protein